jgi:flagellar hook-associated protein 3 FlgL
MRVTDNSNFGTVRDSLTRSRSRLENLQMENATLKKVNRPSDDPVGSAKILEMRTDKVNNDQFQTNAKLVETFLNNTDHALSDLSEVVMRAKEIAVNQASGASSTADTRIGVAEEVKQLFQQAVATGNRRIGDRYIFGGYKTTAAPVDAEGKYLGDRGEVMIEVGREVYMGMNIPGYEAFNTQPEFSSDQQRLQEREQQAADVSRRLASESRSSAVDDSALGSVGAPQNVNIFEELKSLRVGLLTGDLNAIRGTLERLDDIQGKLIATRAKVGSRIQGVQGVVSALERHNITNAQLTSSIEDVDMTQVVSDMAKEETVFKSSLASSKHLIQPTLLDFLR